MEQFPRSSAVSSGTKSGAVLAVRRGGTLLLSLLAHAAFAAVAARELGGAPHAATDSTRRTPAEIAAPELVTAVKAAEVAAPTPAARAPEPRLAHLQRASQAAPRVPAAASTAAVNPEPSRLATAPAVAHFVMNSAPSAERQPEPGASSAAGAPSSRLAAPLLAEHEVDTAARLLAGAPAAYPPSAEAAGIEASVPVELVIDAQGSVRSAAVLVHAGYGLDEAALAAVRRYRFAPARRHGEAVAVRMRWVVRFELR